MQESKKIGIPIIGLINSDQEILIDYPFLGNSDSIFLVHFFCCFLATLISKQSITKNHIGFKNILKKPIPFFQKSKKTKQTHKKFNKQIKQEKKYKSIYFFKPIKLIGFKPIYKQRRNLFSYKWKKDIVLGKVYTTFQRFANEISAELFNLNLTNRKFISKMILLFMKGNLKQKTTFIKRYKVFSLFLIQIFLTKEYKNALLTNNILKLEYLPSRKFIKQNKLLLPLQLNALSYHFCLKKMRSYK